MVKKTVKKVLKKKIVKKPVKINKKTGKKIIGFALLSKAERLDLSQRGNKARAKNRRKREREAKKNA